MHISQFGTSGCPVSTLWGITEAGTPFPRNFTPPHSRRHWLNLPSPLACNVPGAKPDSQAKSLLSARPTVWLDRGDHDDVVRHEGGWAWGKDGGHNGG
jgi:hypothetical protein